MKRYPILLLAIFILMSCSTVSRITVEHDEDKSLIHIDGRSRYLVLPIQDKTKTVSVRVKGADPSVPHMDIRLAVDAIDYYVPFKLPKGKGRGRLLRCWDLPRKPYAGHIFELAMT